MGETLHALADAGADDGSVARTAAAAEVTP